MGKKGRKNGCPVNIRNWVVSILDVATQQFVRIYGLTSLTRTIEGETEDGSADTDIWAEPYITKRSSSCDLEGDKKVIEATGEVDPRTGDAERVRRNERMRFRLYAQIR